VGRVEAFAEGYRGSHSAPSPAYGAPLHDLTQLLPEDVYDRSTQHQYYGTGERGVDGQSFSVINRVRNRPDAQVVVHRAVPGDVESINAGDWVTPSARYAREHAARQLQGGKVLSRTVPAHELWTTGDSLNEFGWHPK